VTNFIGTNLWAKLNGQGRVQAGALSALFVDGCVYIDPGVNTAAMGVKT
jgi:hypothetical protein